MITPVPNHLDLVFLANRRQNILGVKFRFGLCYLTCYGIFYGLSCFFKKKMFNLSSTIFYPVFRSLTSVHISEFKSSYMKNKHMYYEALNTCYQFGLIISNLLFFFLLNTFEMYTCIYSLPKQ